MSDQKEKDKSHVKYETEHGDVTLSYDIVRRFIAKNPEVTDAEAALFIQLCRFQKLNPFLHEAYLIKYGKEPAATVVGKETFTKRAERHNQFDGMVAGIYALNDKNEIVQRNGAFCLPTETVVGGWARAYRKDWEHPIEISVRLEEYIGRKRDGTPNRSWASRPATMIRKVALVQALRETFPDQFAGMYIAEEPQDEETVQTDIKMPGSLSKQFEQMNEKLDEALSTKEEKIEVDYEVVDDDVPEPEKKDEKDQQSAPAEEGGETDWFKAIVKKVNDMKEASKILPIMNRANKAKDDPEALKKIYESLEA